MLTNRIRYLNCQVMRERLTSVLQQGAPLSLFNADHRELSSVTSVETSETVNKGGILGSITESHEPINKKAPEETYGKVNVSALE